LPLPCCRDFLAAAAIYVVVMVLAVGARGEAFQAFSPGMLPPWVCCSPSSSGSSAQVWATPGGRRRQSTMGGALRRGLLVHATGEPETRMVALVRHHIREAADENGRR
jgi:hypothetical protein